MEDEEHCTNGTVGRWTKLEHENFLQGLKDYGKDWKRIGALIQTRTVVQVRTHAQKYFLASNKKHHDKSSSSIAPITANNCINSSNMTDPTSQEGKAPHPAKSKLSTHRTKPVAAPTTKQQLAAVPSNKRLKHPANSNRSLSSGLELDIPGEDLSFPLDLMPHTSLMDSSLDASSVGSESPLSSSSSAPLTPPPSVVMAAAMDDQQLVAAAVAHSPVAVMGNMIQFYKDHVEGDNHHLEEHSDMMVKVEHVKLDNLFEQWTNSLVEEEQEEEPSQLWAMLE